MYVSRQTPTVAAASPSTQTRRRRFPRAAVLLVLVIVAAAAGGGWWLLRPIPVQTARVTTGEAVDAVYASGVVEYVHQASIAPVTTAPIERVAVEEGQAVRPGQLLAQLENGPQQATALQLDAQAALARAAADRAQRLYDAGFGAKAAYEDSRAQLRAAEAAAASAHARLRDYSLSAPFAGRVLRRDAEPGDLASVGKAMFVVADPASLRITADVDERDVGRLAIGQQAVVRADAFPGRSFPATITEITPQGDASGRVFRVRLRLSPDSALRPGMTVETNVISARREHALLVPSASLQQGAVWRIEAGRARHVAVATGAVGADKAEVLSGLRLGDQVIVNPPADLKEGRRVSVRRGG